MKIFQNCWSLQLFPENQICVEFSNLKFMFLLLDAIGFRNKMQEYIRNLMSFFVYKLAYYGKFIT